MNLYPPGHQPFTPRGSRIDQHIVDMIQIVARKHSLPPCVLESGGFAQLARDNLEIMRAMLFRAEQLAQAASPLFRRDILVESVHELQWKRSLSRRCRQYPYVLRYQTSPVRAIARSPGSPIMARAFALKRRCLVLPLSLPLTFGPPLRCCAPSYRDLIAVEDRHGSQRETERPPSPHSERYPACRHGAVSAL